MSLNAVLTAHGRKVSDGVDCRVALRFPAIENPIAVK